MTDLTLPFAALSGWVVGAPLGLAARLLAGEPRPDDAPRGWHLVAVDPALQAYQAISMVALAFRFGLSWQLAIYGLLNLVLTLIFFLDLRTRYVYGIVAYPGILVGVVLTPMARGGIFWEGVAGATLGAGIFGAFYLAGRLLYRGKVPLASGDVIVAALVGSVVGIGQVVPALVMGILIGGVLAIAYAVRWRSVQVYLPYGPGLCLGALLALLR